MAGLSKYEGKDKRRERLRNHIARDLHSSKYHQRVIPNKKKQYDDEEEDHFDGLLFDARANGYGVQD